MKRNLFSIVLIVLCAIITSCSDNNDGNGEYGRLSVQLTDAPFPHDLVAEANVTIFKVDARFKSEDLLSDEHATDDTDSEMETDNDGAFVILKEDEVQVNLLELTNGVTNTLVDSEVPVGSYDLIRVYVKGINVVLTDGTTYDLNVPSGSQTGIKVFIKPGIQVIGGLTSDILLDFDVSKSFVAMGGGQDLKDITGFNFKPVIKGSNMSTSGTLTGRITEVIDNVSVGVEGVQIAVFNDEASEDTATFTDADGGYMIMGLDAGLYTVEVEKAGYLMQTTEDVQINAANKTALDFVLKLQE